MLKLLINFPMMCLAILSYVGVLAAGVLGLPALNIPLPSGQICFIAWADIVLIFGLLMLAIELLKATRTGFGSMSDHVFSTILLIVMAVIFFVVPGFGTVIFFTLTVMQLIDVACGVIITITAVRRDVGIDGIGALS